MTETRTRSNAPLPLSYLAKVSDAGGALIIQFDVDTNRAGQSGVFPCSTVFDDASAEALGGSASVCLWRDARTLVARFGYYASVAINDLLSLRQGVIGRLDSPSVTLDDYESRVLLVISPDTPAAPVVVIEGTSAVGWCDVLTLDASASYGSGGRAYVGGYQWGLVAPEDNSTDVTEGVALYLASQRDVVVSLDGSSLSFNTTRTYTFSLTLTNWLGLSSTAYFPVEIIATDQVIVRIAGGNPTIQRGTDLSLRGSVEPPCVCKRDASLAVCDPEARYSYAWVRTGGPVVALDLASRTSSALHLPANALQAGATYRFTLTATSAGLLGHVGQATVTVTVLDEPVRAVLESGTRYVSRYAPIELDGSLRSSPAQHDEGEDDQVSYQWSCAWAGSADLAYEGVDDGACPAARYLGTAAYQAPHVTLPAGTLPPGDWRFTLTVTRAGKPFEEEGAEKRGMALDVATADQLVTIGWGDAPTVFVRLLAAGDNVDPSADALVKFEASVASPLGRTVSELAWSLVDGDIDANLTAVVDPGSDAAVLAFRPDVLTPGAQYRLRLVARYADDLLQPADWATTATGGLPWAASTPAAAGWAEVTFAVGAFPWGGTCDLQLPEGEGEKGPGRTALATALCAGFDAAIAANADDGPVFTHYYVRHSADVLGGLFPLGSHRSVAAGRVETYLPSTGSAGEESLALYARVFDRTGSPAYAPPASAAAEGEAESDSAAEPRLLEVASGVVVQAALADSAEAVAALLASGAGLEAIQRGRVDLVPTLLYSLLFELNTAVGTAGNPFAVGSTERDVREAVFDVLRRQLAFERSADATTVQAHLLYLLAGGSRTTTTTAGRRGLHTVAPKAKRSGSTDLGLHVVQHLRELVAASPQSSDRAYIANAASNLLEYYKALALDSSAFASELVALITELAVEQAAASAQTRTYTWSTPNIQAAAGKCTHPPPHPTTTRHSASDLPATMQAGGVTVTLPTADIRLQAGGDADDAEVVIALCTFALNPQPSAGGNVTLMAPVTTLIVRVDGRDIALAGPLTQNFIIAHPAVISENPNGLNIPHSCRRLQRLVPELERRWLDPVLLARRFGFRRIGGRIEPRHDVCLLEPRLGRPPLRARLRPWPCGAAQRVAGRGGRGPVVGQRRGAVDPPRHLRRLRHRRPAHSAVRVPSVHPEAGDAGGRVRDPGRARGPRRVGRAGGRARRRGAPRRGRQARRDVGRRRGRPRGPGPALGERLGGQRGAPPPQIPERTHRGSHRARARALARARRGRGRTADRAAAPPTRARGDDPARAPSPAPGPPRDYEGRAQRRGLFERGGARRRAEAGQRGVGEEAGGAGASRQAAAAAAAAGSRSREGACGPRQAAATRGGGAQAFVWFGARARQARLERQLRGRGADRQRAGERPQQVQQVQEPRRCRRRQGREP
ncbi:uncharacterized protein ACA1_139410 [Acanthamoeba castellanii str. Neff]|uniref:PKD/REJ-like domain-containing protein n=1 Tax=Acanthamoeba castellanii (strain ATCC 30010 / Neff) TaxID=1257118 RepID=L8GN19_ACACF|nr:uncharacterized protein ACA1_139410 [Acanthamoeba castellanii str. Neff]ELR14224.1 hypothetical protein ACA1_139410 [Acanthamoeba castellanii str. Neff]